MFDTITKVIKIKSVVDVSARYLNDNGLNTFNGYIT